MFSQLIANSNDVQSLEEFIGSSQPLINDFINSDFEIQRQQVKLFEQFVLLGSRVQMLDALDFSKSENRALISILFDYAERVNASAVIVQLYRIIRKHNLDIGSRLEASILYLYNVPNNLVYIARFDEICTKLQTAIEEEDDDESKAITTFLNYYSSIILNTAPHLQFAQEIQLRAQESVDKFSFLQNKIITDALSLDINNIDYLYSTIQATIDRLLSKKNKHFSHLGTDFIIESNTDYARKLSNIPKSFDEIRKIAVSSLATLQNRDDVFSSLNRGVAILTQEEQLFLYLNSYGLMHKAKLTSAFSHFPFNDVQDCNIEICDWSCGQGMASIVLLEYLDINNIDLTINRITLIEPSEIALKRAALHVRHFNSEIEIRTILKDMDSLMKDDIICTNDSIKIHLFSNILDIETFSMQYLTDLIKQTFNGINYFISISPYINDIKTARFDSFTNSFRQNASFTLLHQDEAKRGEWKHNWTKLINIFCLNSL